MERLRQKICANPTPEQEYACPKEDSSTGESIPQSTAPKASNPLVAAVRQFGEQISQVLIGSAPTRDPLVAAIPTVIDTPTRKTSLDKPGGTLVAQEASSIGQWSAPINWPLIVIHAAVGPNGKVLTWTRPKMSPKINPNTGQPVPKYTLWNPADSSFSAVPDVNTDIFCASHAFAPSGNLLVVGGTQVI